MQNHNSNTELFAAAPAQPGMGAGEPAPPGVSTLEMSGVLTSRMLHELTNHLTVVVGNLQVMEMAPDDKDLAEKAMTSIRQASHALGEVVERYASFRRQIRNDAQDCPAARLVDWVALGPPPSPLGQGQGEARPPAPGDWPVTAPASLEGWLPVEARWLRYAIWEVARLSGSRRGKIEFFPPGQLPDLRGLHLISALTSRQDYLPVAITWTASQLKISPQDLHKPPSLTLAVVIGLVRWVNGQAGVAFHPPDENQFWILIPVDKRR